MRFDPGGDDAVGILHVLNSDPLYVRLCQAQACFRARLTAKPWRCDVSRPPSRFPWLSIAQEARYRQWEQGYDRTAANYAACLFLRQVGVNEVHPDVEPVLSLHDSIACAAPAKALA